jgi:23S rRNA (guanosine2251-2'-O)-methyltransferase
VKKEDFIYGVHPVLEALRSGQEIEKIIFTGTLKREAASELRQLAAERSVPMQNVPAEWFYKLPKVNHQGIICYLSAIEYHPIEQLLPMIYERGEVPLLLILDRITDVRNFGAITRTAECAGVHAIVLPSHGHAMINQDALKTSSGALCMVPVCRVDNLKKIINYLKFSGLTVIAATEKADAIYDEICLTEPLAIIMGSEEDGVSPAYLSLCDNIVKIPMAGNIGSLNVSVATGIMLFEVARQRR